MIRFDGGLEIPCSASPQVVPSPMSDETAVDPEEAFVTSLTSCHMLWFLGLAAKSGFRIDRYADAATGLMKKNNETRFDSESDPPLRLSRDARFQCGKSAMTIAFGARRPGGVVQTEIRDEVFACPKRDKPRMLQNLLPVAASVGETVATAYAGTFRLLVVLCGLLAALSGLIAGMSLGKQK